ncbi:hypothetical protein [Microbacterium plantarum]|uniref:hypothetical protein n=1 Tax=Microbacterium plantarum TaxID=1816425 RepID=UPI002B499A1A|nr:hypothetical protein [Microbacterium plantarum]WRK16749.1 hypothetical protein VC184_12645 [Microbacterium plantarum]
MRSTSRMTMTALAVGLVLTMTGCGGQGDPGSTGGAGGGESGETYAQAEQRFTALATGVHSVIMAIEPAEWSVVDGAYGAHPTGCQSGLSEEGGYRLVAVRGIELPGRDPLEVAQAATGAFDALGIDSDTADRGQGDAREVTVVATGGIAERTVVTIRPATGQVRVSAETECAPGSAHDLAMQVFGEERLPADVWRRLPAFDGPTSEPSFSFPPDGPLYYDESGNPVQPQPSGD